MSTFAPIDWLAAAFFVLSWGCYAWLVELSPWRDRTLTAAMNAQRRRWMETMLHRENRMIDAQIIAGLQTGSSFFASTSLLAIGAAFALLTTSEQVLGIVKELPIELNASRILWELKAIGLLVIYAYAFFKFGWSFRLFNYVSILIGATPTAEHAHTDEGRIAIARAAEMSVIAGRHFSRGQRALFLSIGYLGWFASPWLFLAVTLVVVISLATRQFAFPGLRLFRQP